MADERELKTLFAGLCVFGAVYLCFNSIILVPTALNQYNLGSFNYGTSNNLGAVSNATIIRMVSYSGISLLIILPIVIIAGLLIAILMSHFAHDMVRETYKGNISKKVDK